MEILLAIAACALLFALWPVLVWRIYRLKRPPPSRVTVVAPDGWTLSMYHRAPAQRRYEEPILLCHGLAANHRNMDFEPPHSLAGYFADAGFECFSVDWRGTLGSRGAPPGRRWTDYCIDDHIALDGPAFLAAALERTSARRAFWVGHSLGGLVGYGVAEGPAAPMLAGLVTIGSPAFFRYPRSISALLWISRLLAWPFAIRQRWFSVMSAPFLGHITLPLTDVVMNPQHIPPKLQRKIYAQVITSTSRTVLAQFEDWLRHDRFASRDGKTDYRAGLGAVRLPLLIAGGACDRLAPPQVVQAVFDAVGSEDRTRMIFGCENGDALDYGHGDLIFGRSAPTEVYPRLLAWLRERATRLGAAPT